MFAAGSSSYLYSIFLLFFNWGKKKLGLCVSVWARGHTQDFCQGWLRRLLFKRHAALGEMGSRARGRGQCPVFITQKIFIRIIFYHNSCLQNFGCQDKAASCWYSLPLYITPILHNLMLSHDLGVARKL